MIVGSSDDEVGNVQGAAGGARTAREEFGHRERISDHGNGVGFGCDTLSTCGCFDERRVALHREQQMCCGLVRLFLRGRVDIVRDRAHAVAGSS
jgi:hypothetical protein